MLRRCMGGSGAPGSSDSVKYCRRLNTYTQPVIEKQGTYLHIGFRVS